MLQRIIVVLCNHKTPQLNCSVGKQSPNGIQTGKCIMQSLGEDIPSERQWVCEVYGWCPVAVWPPLKRDEGAILDQAKNTVISIQNYIKFSEFDISMRTADHPTLDCNYNPINNSQCPYFRLEDVIKYSHNNYHSFDYIAAKTGGVFEIRIEYNCNARKDECHPEYSFWRRDNENSNPPPLLSFRQIKELDSEKRLMRYGWRLKFNIVVTGYVERFNRYKLLTIIFEYGSVLIIILWLSKSLILDTLRSIRPSLNRTDDPEDIPINQESS